MRRALLPTAIAAIICGTNPVHAATDLEQRVQRLERLVQHLEQRVSDQGLIIKNQEDTITQQQAQLRKAPAPASSGVGEWFQGMKIGGAVEVEASHTEPYSGQDGSDITLATATLNFSSQVNDWISAEASLLYEEDDTPLELDTGTITVAAPGSNWAITAGQFYTPFGAYNTNLISDPMTLDLGETRESALQAGFDDGTLNANLFIFNGDNKKDSGADDRVDNWGASLGGAHEVNGLNLAAAVGYINDIGDSDTLQAQINTNLGGTNDVLDHVGGWAFSAIAEAGPITLIGEYVGASDRFQATELGYNGRGAKPRAWMAEAGYGFDAFGRSSTLAIGYQGTKEALDMGLPKRRWLVGWSIDVLANTTLSFEWAHDRDYPSSDTSISTSGTGNTANTLTTQLAVEFP